MRDGASRLGTGERRILAPGPRLAAITDVGLVRANNEDDFHLTPDGSLLAVADGLGGLPAGEIASTTAITAIAECIWTDAASVTSEAQARTLLIEAFAVANADILAKAAADPYCRGMATTLVVAIVAGATMYVSHIGDVRAYLYRTAGRLDLLTDDHTVAWELVEAGKLSREEARHHPNRNALTRVLGLNDVIEPSFSWHELAPGDSILLCSDGVWEPVGSDEIAKQIADTSRDAESVVSALVDLALARGGPDNATIALERCGS